jgi:ABC-type branched-subunit amino acid transport system substrate-binding protein
MSGPIGALGVEQRRGLDMAIADLGGKIGGLSVDLTADDQADAAAAVQAVEATDKDKVDPSPGIVTPR